MRELGHRVLGWLDERGAPVAATRAFLDKPVPRNVAWLHTLGSLLLVYLCFQVLTGVLLGFYYSGSTHDAYASVRYVAEELTLGSFLLKLHRFGAGFLLVTAFLHFARSYFLAAYKAPRELLWLTGLLLGILLTLFAFTGQLLPYDQRGYWATVVGVEIASSAPVAGDWVRTLLTGGYGEIGPVTLNRFYVLHVAVLPLVFAALVVVHLSILQKVGSAGPTAGPPEPYKSFYPSQMLRDVVASALGAVALFAVAGVLTLHDSGPADSTGSDFTPRPEWYFLAHYELLKWLPGVVGAFLLPNAVLGLLVLLPFVDRGPERSLGGRKLATAAGVLACLAVVGLTAKGIASGPSIAVSTSEDRDSLEWGRELLSKKKCLTCHSLAGEGGDNGPALDGVSQKIRFDFLPNWIRNPTNFKPTTEMPAFEGSEDELRAIVAFLLERE